MISPLIAQAEATEIVKILNKEGYIAYFAGGWVRDHLLNHPSADIDIATNAPIEVILDLFPRTLLVGLAFGVVIVFIKDKQFEVSTFRRDLDYTDGRRPNSIELATPEEDALRRDFTINGMFYDPINHIIHDFVHGAEDLKRGIIRTIGEADERFQEDRLRMIRAFRFAARFGFNIDPETQEAIFANAPTLFPSVAMERVWQEFNKMSHYPTFAQALVDMHRLELLQVIFPTLRGVHLSEIKKRVFPISGMSSSVPTILKLMQLFPDQSPEERIEISNYLRASNRDIKLIYFYTKVEQLIKKENAEGIPWDPVQWVPMYSHHDWEIVLEAIANRYPLTEKMAFIDMHRQRKQGLLPHVERVKFKKPLVTSSELIKNGISPGKDMGKLLREAEIITWRHDIHDPHHVIGLLKQSDLWPIDFT